MRLAVADPHLVYADLIDADPPPRELTPVVRRYIAAQAPYAWLVLFVLFVASPTALFAAFAPSRDTIISAVVTLAVAIALGVWTAKKRARVRTVIVEGRQVPARIRSAHHLVVRQGLARGRRVSLHVEVEGRVVRCVSWAGDLDDSESGAWIRVLVHPNIDFVVPVVSVT